MTSIAACHRRLRRFDPASDFFARLAWFARTVLGSARTTDLIYVD